MIDDFIIEVTELENDYYYKLYDYQIEVPDTGIKNNKVVDNLFLLSLICITGIYFIRKYAY